VHLSLQILLGTVAVVLLVAGIATFVTAAGQRAVTSDLRRFLGIRRAPQAHVASERVPDCYLVDLVLATRAVLADRGLEFEELGIRGVLALQGMPLFARADLPSLLAGTVSAGVGSPRLEDVPVAPDREEALPRSVLFQVRHPDHNLLIQTLQAPDQFSPGSFEVACKGDPEAIAFTTALAQEIEDRAEADSVYRGHIVKPYFKVDGGPSSIAMESCRGEDDPTLPPELLRELEEAFLGFKSHREALSAQGIPTQRGLLLAGPPGTGKTSTCRYLKRMLPDHTFVAVPIASLTNLAGVFEMARRFAPAVVVLDDVDLYARDREQNLVNGLLGELMTQMDGLSAREEIDVIMTSNSWKSIEEALALRPGRIDTVILYEKPGEAQRERLLERFLARVETDVEIPELVEHTEGFTPAQIRELTTRAVVRAALRAEGLEADAPARVRRADFRAAARALEGNPLLERPKSAAVLGRRTAPLLELRRPPPEDGA